MAVLLAALLLRLPAVLFSKGFMASDDHYETVMVAYNWLCHGFFAEDGRLLWRNLDARELTRFPLYTLFLHGIMRVLDWLGVRALDTMMYGVRASHALLSLLSVWAAYRLTEMSTRSTRWAAAAGLLIAAHGLMPFLAVRTLIEVVAGHFLIIAVYLLYRWERKPAALSLLWWAGVMVGLAWMIRFASVLAAVPLPFLLWWQARRIRPALWFSAGALAMVALSGYIDYELTGRFADSTRNLLAMFFDGGEAMYDTPVYLYAVVLLAFFVPPFSLAALGPLCGKRLWRQHALLGWMIFSFVLLHSLLTNRQERFMLPIAPLLAVFLILALWYHFRENGFWARHRKWWHAVVGVSLAVNIGVLVVFTANYAHRGMVEPLVRIERMRPKPRPVFVSPERGRIYPRSYAGCDSPGLLNIKSWADLQRYRPRAGLDDCFIVYPSTPEDLPRYVDSLTAYCGVVEEIFYVGPSIVDRLLHAVNPRHNPSNEVWGYRKQSSP